MSCQISVEKLFWVSVVVTGECLTVGVVSILVEYGNGASLPVTWAR